MIVMKNTIVCEVIMLRRRFLMMLAVVVIITGLFLAGMCIGGNNKAYADDDIDPVEIAPTAVALALDGTLKIRIHFNGDVNEEDGWTVNGEKVVTTDRIATYRVAAKEFLDCCLVIKCGDEIKLTIYMKDMLKRYKMLEATEDIAEAIEDYCEAAREYFGGEVVEDYSYLWNEIKIEIGEHMDYEIPDYLSGRSLILESGVLLRFYFCAPVEGAKRDDMYSDFYIDYPIPAHCFSQKDSFCVNDYIYNVLSSEESDADLKNICAALYNYGKVAEMYFYSMDY